MASETVRVVASLKAVDGKGSELIAVLMDLIRATRREQGCIRYELLRGSADASDFVFVEEWSSAAAFDEHLKSPHLQDAVKKATPLLAQSPDIRRYSLVA